MLLNMECHAKWNLTQNGMGVNLAKVLARAGLLGPRASRGPDHLLNPVDIVDPMDWLKWVIGPKATKIEYKLWTVGPFG